MRRLGILFREAPFHFAELRHQIAFRVQPAGGIAEKKIDLTFRGGLIRLITKRRGIGVVLTANHFHAEALGPNSKLLDGGGAKCVGGGEQHATSILPQIVGEFRGRCRLARTVDANDQDDFRFFGKGKNRFRMFWQNAQQFFARDFDDVVDPQQRPCFAVLQLLQNSRGDRHADIGADERFFELVPIDWFAGECLGERFEKLHFLDRIYKIKKDYEQTPSTFSRSKKSS